MERTSGHSTRGSARRSGRAAKPIHVAVAAGFDKGVKMFSSVADRGGIGDADAIEAERERFAGEGGFEISWFDGTSTRSSSRRTPGPITPLTTC